MIGDIVPYILRESFGCPEIKCPMRASVLHCVITLEDDIVICLVAVRICGLNEKKDYIWDGSEVSHCCGTGYHAGWALGVEIAQENDVIFKPRASL